VISAADSDGIRAEAHDTINHARGPSLYYEEQIALGGKKGATEEFWKGGRVPKISVIFRKGCWKSNGGSYLTGRRLTYAELSLFHDRWRGLRYAFPKTA